MQFLRQDVQIKLFWEATKQRYNKCIIPERGCRNVEICNYISSAKGSATPTSASDCFGPQGLKPGGGKRGGKGKKKKNAIKVQPGSDTDLSQPPCIVPPSAPT